MVVTLDTSISIRADEDFPVNRGQMCIKGFNSHELFSRTDRLLYPLKKNDTGGFDQITWQQALDEIAGKIIGIQTLHGRDAMSVFGSGALTNEKAYLLGKFARVALKTANIDYNGRYCMSSAAAGANRAFGVDRGMPFPVDDIAKTGCVMLWGSNLVDTLPPIVQYFNQQKSRGGKTIVVDPRKTETARQADLHLQLTPGTDLLLANGLLHVAIEENLIDRNYIQLRTRGFEELLAVANRYHPAYVERITGVSYDQMRTTVRWLVETSSMILSGRGPEQQSKGADSVGALINLMLALGKVGKPYSGYGTLTGQGNGQGGREHGQKSDQLVGYRLIENPEHRKQVANFWGIDEKELPRKGKSAVELIHACGDQIKGMIVMGSNIAVATPGMKRVEDHLKQLDLLVVCDAFLNETAQLADYILPTWQFTEEDGTMTNLEGRVIRRRKITTAPETTRSDTQILIELASRLNAGRYFSFNNHHEIFDEFRRATAGSIADYSGISYEKIDANLGVFWPCPNEKHAGTPRLFADSFYHADGKARFIPVEHRPAGEEPDDEFPLFFTTGRYKEHYNSGAQTRGVQLLVNARPIPKVQLHPQLASQHNIVDGQMITIESRRDKITMVANVTNEIRPDTLFAPFHWGGKDAANRLTNPALDSTSKMPEFKICAVRIITSNEHQDETHG